MKFSLIALAALTLWTSIGFADPMELKDIDKDDVVTQLEKSGTVFAVNLESTRDYAAKFKYVESYRAINTFSHLGNVMPGIFILDLTFAPDPRPTSGSFPEIYVKVYFHAPTHFERTTTGKVTYHFYKFESVVNVVNIGPRQPGDISSAGGGRK